MVWGELRSLCLYVVLVTVLLDVPTPNNEKMLTVVIFKCLLLFLNTILHFLIGIGLKLRDNRIILKQSLIHNLTISLCMPLLT